MDFVKSIDNVYNDSKKAIQDADGNLLLTHSGEMNSDTISDLSEKAESKLFEINAAKKNIKNIFNILIEGLQNIKNHGEFGPENNQFSFFHMYDQEESFICNFSNLIDTSPKGYTVLTVANRLNTIINSNKILILNYGKIVEFDIPDSLIKNKEGHFSKLLTELNFKSRIHKLKNIISS